jgi:hypothetical protein
MNSTTDICLSFPKWKIPNGKYPDSPRRVLDPRTSAAPTAGSYLTTLAERHRQVKVNIVDFRISNPCASIQDRITSTAKLNPDAGSRAHRLHAVREDEGFVALDPKYAWCMSAVPVVELLLPGSRKGQTAS